MKMTLLADWDSGTILDIHCTTNRPYDTKIGWQVLRRFFNQLEVITADKGYNADDLRWWLRASDVRPVIKHRLLSTVDTAHNAWLDMEVYHRRSVSGVGMRVLKQRYGDQLAAGT